MRLSKTFVRFLAVGVFVFAIDVVLFKAAFKMIGVVEASRVLSYSAATFFAWLANSSWTFADKGRGFLVYFLNASAAGAQNVAISAFVMRFQVFSAQSEIIGITIGCLYGLLFNFYMQRNFTFPKKLGSQ